MKAIEKIFWGRSSSAKFILEKCVGEAAGPVAVARAANALIISDLIIFLFIFNY